MPGEGLTEFGGHAFGCCTDAYGDIVLPDSLTTMPKGTFRKTKITSIVFGKSTMTLDPNWQPHIGECKSLTNVVFKSGGNISIVSHSFFSNCTVLKDIDLSGVVSITNSTTSYPHLNACYALTNVTFGAGLMALHSLFFQSNGNGNLCRVEFLGAPPANFEMPYLNEIKNTQKVLTVIPADKKAEWAPYVTDPTFRDEFSTWKPECLRDGCDPTMRPIRTTAWQPKPMKGWVYANGKLSYGGWQFNATVSGKNLTVGTCTADPGENAVLDFTLPVQDADYDYTIVAINPAFGNYANKAHLTTLLLPTNGLYTIGDKAFNGTGISGALKLPLVTAIGYSAFKATGITSAELGPHLKSMTSGWTSGVFDSCTALKKVVFDPSADVALDNGGMHFYNCDALEYVDFGGVKNFTAENASRQWFNKNALKTLILRNPTNINCFAFYGGAAPTFHIYGGAPVVSTNMSFGGNYTMFVHIDKDDPDYASKRASWNALTQEGTLDYESTWKRSLLSNPNVVRGLYYVDHMNAPDSGAYFKATWSEDTKTLKFYYDAIDHSQVSGVTTQFLVLVDSSYSGGPAWNNNTYNACRAAEHVVFDNSFVNYLPSSCDKWFNEFKTITTVEDIENLNTANCTGFGQMFRDCTAMTSLDLSHFRTKKVTTMGYMLRNMKVTELDLSSFDTQNVTDTAQMFIGDTSLKTIYVSDKFVTTKVTSSANMFGNCTSLVGGKGTVFDSTKTDKTYARIDGGTAAPGYFTDKFAVAHGLVIFFR